MWLDFSGHSSYPAQEESGCHTQLFPLHSCFSEADTALHVVADEIMELFSLLCFRAVCFTPQTQ